MIIYLKRSFYLFIVLLLLCSCQKYDKSFFHTRITGLKNGGQSGRNNIATTTSTQERVHITVVIDVFRAFTTASYILSKNPASYVITTKSSVISRLISKSKDYLLIGKAEKGTNLVYGIPNSPTRVCGLEVAGKNVLHRTEAGAKGILLSKNSDIILVASFVNAEATVRYIKTIPHAKVTILPMGHEGTTPSIEDDLCACHIEALMNNKKINIATSIPKIMQTSGKYFFTSDQWQYPAHDFNLCLERERFNFAIKATVIDDYAILSRCD
jgi:2-phosphosulfolactate phosphatase